MISNEAQIAIFVISGLVLLFMALQLIVQRVRMSAVPTDGDEETRSLNHPQVRLALEAFLARHLVRGDADIRDGKVLVPVDPLSIHPVAVRLANAYRVRRRLRNPNADMLYIRDPMTDRFRPVDLDLDDIGETVRLLQTVAVDRGEK